MRLKFFFIISSIIFFISSCQALAANYNADYSKVTTDAKLVNVLEFMNEIPQKNILNTIMGDNISGRPIKLMFKNLGDLNYNYRNYEALACKDTLGNLYILINTKHKDAPVEALVSILSHEVIHQDDVSSIQEEVQGWTNEALTWIAMKKLNPELNNPELEKYPLVKRLNTMERLYKEANNTSQKIELAVSSNYGYRNLAMHSPGF